MLQTSDQILQQRHDDLDWATRDPALRQRYEGQLIVVHRRQVLAAGLDRAELLRQSASAEHPREELVVVEFPASDFELPTD